MTQHKQSHRIKWRDHHIKWHDMTCHVATNHSSSPHVTSQRTTILHVTPQATSWHQNRSHYHRGTAESSFEAKKWFGHGAGRSPGAHSIGKVFLCYIVLFSSETSAPGSPGNYLYTNYKPSSAWWFFKPFLFRYILGACMSDIPPLRNVGVGFDRQTGQTWPGRKNFSKFSSPGTWEWLDFVGHIDDPMAPGTYEGKHGGVEGIVSLGL